MTIVDTDKLSTKYKCIFCTMLTEKASEYITDLRGWLLLKNGITKFWEWIETGRYCGDDIYGLAEADDYLTGFPEYAMEAQDRNDKSAGAWCSVVEAVMYIARKVYEKDGDTSFAEPVDEVEEDMIQLAIERLSETADVQDYTDEIYDLCLKETAIADIQHRFGLYQMKFDFAKLSEKYKCVFLLTLAEKAVSCIENETERDYAKCALEACWEWVDTGKHSGATLIEFIGDDDSGLYYYEITEREPIVTTALNFVVTAVSFVARIAFENEGVWDMPKFAAVTTDAVIPYVLDRFTMCYKDTNAYISNVCKIALTEKNGFIAYNKAITEVQKMKINKTIDFVMETADVEKYTNELYALCLNEMDITGIKQRFTPGKMNINFDKLSERYKCVFLLMLADKALSSIENEEERDLSESALQACWEWLDTGAHSGAALIQFAGDNDNGLFSYEIMEEDQVVTAALNFVVTTVRFVARVAFESEDVQDMPKFAVVTTDAVIPYALDTFTMCYNNANQYIPNVYKICLEEREPGYYYQIVKQF